MRARVGAAALGLGMALLTAWPEAAVAQDVGIGVGMGASYAPSTAGGDSLGRRGGDSLAGGFFVDVPVHEVVVVSPGATLWGVDLGEGKKPATDLDLNIKLRVQLTALRLSAGVGAGISHVDQSLAGHLTALASGGLQLSPRVEVFVQLAYKHLVLSRSNVENLHGLAGAVFYL